MEAGSLSCRRSMSGCSGRQRRCGRASPDSLCAKGVERGSRACEFPVPRTVSVMATLRIQHVVPSFEAWKRAFDNDPMDRAGSGVRNYHVSRSTDDPNLVMIDLEFGSAEEAE